MIAFEGWPKLVVPPVTAQHGKRVFQLRTYESPSNQDHVRKVEMFHNGEFEIFARAGFWQVFFGDTLDWSSPAPVDLYGQFSGHIGDRREVGRVSLRSAMEKAVGFAQIQFRSDREQPFPTWCSGRRPFPRV
jgi:hypothetical protein